MSIHRRRLLDLLFKSCVACLPLHRVLNGYVRAVGENPTQLHGWVEGNIQKLSLEEKIGQMLQIRCYPGNRGSEYSDYQTIRELVQRYHIGSIVLGMHVTASGPLRNSPSDVAETTNRLQNDSTLPLLVAADIERGLASRMLNVPSFPWPMAFGAVNSETDVECFGAMTAREARAVGIHWALAPVADLNTNPSNPIINDRSFGEDPGDVGILVAAYIRGARRHGLLVTAKHFPGQGDTSVDSHRGVPSVDGTLNHLEAFEFRPFKSAIDAGVDSVMVAHARVSAVEPDPNKVATVSRKVVTDLLRDKLGFNGVILTDALEMKGLTSLYNPRDGSPTALAAVDAVKAGCDVIMVPADLQSAFRAILNAVRNGEIPSTRIDDSVRRILKMKADIGLNSSRCVPLGQVVELTSKSEDVAFAQQIADQAITLVRENGRTLPLKTIRTYSPLTKNNLRTILLAEAFETSNGQEFEKAIRVRRPDSSVYYVDNRIANTDVIELLKSVTDADEVVVAVYLVHHGVRQIAVNGLTTTVFGPVGPSGRLLREILAVAADKTVVVALGSPYLIESFPQIQNYVCAYAMASSSEISAVKALFGEIQNAATLPVTLPGAGARGSSRPWPTQPRAIVS